MARRWIELSFRLRDRLAGLLAEEHVQIDAEDDADLLHRNDFLRLRQVESLEANLFNQTSLWVSELLSNLWVFIAAQEEVQQGIERKAEIMLQLVLVVVVLRVDLFNSVDHYLDHSDYPLQSLGLLYCLAG